jgi:hypothetical protein
MKTYLDFDFAMTSNVPGFTRRWKMSKLKYHYTFLFKNNTFVYEIYDTLKKKRYSVLNISDGSEDIECWDSEAFYSYESMFDDICLSTIISLDKFII